MAALKAELDDVRKERDSLALTISKIVTAFRALERAVSEAWT